VGPRDVLDAVVKRKIPSPRRESNPRSPIVVGMRELDLSGSGYGSVAGSCEHGNELSRSIKGTVNLFIS
jgi:hypothetical protein